MPTIADVIGLIEDFAPLSLQESYDNSGLQVGDRFATARAAMLCLDVSEAVVDEAIARGANLIISHHPLLFKGLKRITGGSAVERIVAKAIKNDIAIYSSHTCMDCAAGGVSFRAAELLGLKNVRVLEGQRGKMLKLVTFVPEAAAHDVEQALWRAGAGQMGEYDRCSYKMHGSGTFRALDGAQPYVGKPGEQHIEAETRIEVVLPLWRKEAVVRALIAAHPYEEPAFDILALENDAKTGLGIIGDTETEDAMDFLKKLKNTFSVHTLTYSGTVKDEKISRVAFCGGSAIDVVESAIAQGADVLVTGDVKYHEFTSNNDRILIVDIGHYESECHTKGIFYDIIKKKMPNFATYYAELEKNPINYL